MKLACIIVTLFAGIVAAQDVPALKAAKLTVELWPEGKMPGHGAEEPQALHSPERTDATRVTNVSKPTISFFPVEKKNAPAMIISPGGGYKYTVVDKEGAEIAAWLNKNGIAAFVLKYRTPNNRDGALQDIQRAISLVRSRATEWSIDPNNLGVIGFSAGGHLSARASNRFSERAYPVIDDIDKQICRPDFAVLVYPAYLNDGKGNLSADLDPKANIPPTLIVHSEDDKSFVAGSKIYESELSAAKLTHQFLLYQTGGHGYGLHCEREAKAWPDAAIKWLNEIGVGP